MAENKLAVKTVIGVLQQPMVVARFKEVLGQRAPKFVSSLISAVHMTPALQKCDATSVMSAGMIAASIDIPINQSLGFAYIIPYGNLAQFQLGAKGFIQLAERTGQYQTINVSSVYADEIESWNPITGVLKLTDMKKWKLRGKENSEDIVGYAAYFKMTNGFEKWHYMTVKQLIVHGKKYSKSYETGQWKKDPPAMYNKTVIKQLLSKWGMMSIDIQGAEQLQKAIESDQMVIDEQGNPESQDNPISKEGAAATQERISVLLDEITIAKGKSEELEKLYSKHAENPTEYILSLEKYLAELNKDPNELSLGKIGKKK